MRHQINGEWVRAGLVQQYSPRAVALQDWFDKQCEKGIKEEVSILGFLYEHQLTNNE